MVLGRRSLNALCTCVQYPWSNLNTSFDTETLKGVMKTLRDNAVKEHKENE